ncbi:MAG TPA: sigma-70 family RNA polymerase sigma factor [Miltoncostaeaceae bacterium]|nr:sigma-70 family RNA polymerase sigma factor [Miltoncostaeaceae bacterium]
MISTTEQAPPTDAERRQAVLRAMGRGPGLLRYAARFAPTFQDAEDAYQRAMVIALTKAPTVEADGFAAWLHAVLRNEALATARSLAREGPSAEADLRDTAAETLTPPRSVETLAAWRERYRALDEALSDLTEAQRTCLILQSAGQSYGQIGEITGFSARKVERSVLEGRRRLRHWQVDLIEGVVCERLAPALERVIDGEADRREARRISKHVKHCGACRGRLRHERELHRRLAALAPLPLLIGAPAVPDPGHLMAWWDRLTQSLGMHGTSVAQTLNDLSGSGVARLGAGTTAVVIAGAAGLPLVVDAVKPRDPAPPPARVRTVAERPAATAPPLITPARPVSAATGGARATTRSRPAPARARVRRPRPQPRPGAPAARTPAPSGTRPPAPVAPTAAPTPVSTPSASAGGSSSLALEFGP